MLLKCLYIFQRLISLQLGLYLTYLLIRLITDINGHYADEIAEHKAYLYLWVLGLVPPEFELCQKRAGCRTFHWIERGQALLIIILTHIWALILNLYLIFLLTVVFVQMTVDLNAIIYLIHL